MSTFSVPFYENSLKVVYTDRGVTDILWQKQKVKQRGPSTEFEKQFTENLRAYLEGRESFKQKVDWKSLAGTEFQKQVWKRMAKIPHGKTVSYGDLAEDLGRPGAARAVGTACGKNPVLLAIPCHRVLGKSGLGGFSGGGISVKKKLLGLEESQH